MATARRKTFDMFELRFLHLADELPGVGTEAFDVAPLSFGVDRVHRQRGFSGTARAATDGQFVAGDIDIDVFKIMLLRAADLDVLGEVGDEGRAARG